jgi:hypothetical protein
MMTKTRGRLLVKFLTIARLSSLAVALLATSCKGSSKIEIPVAAGQTYTLQPSGKLKVYGTAADGASPLQKLLVKRRNEGAGATTQGCWQCSDCICNGGECACTECTSC